MSYRQQLELGEGHLQDKQTWQKAEERALDSPNIYRDQEENDPRRQTEKHGPTRGENPRECRTGQKRDGNSGLQGESTSWMQQDDVKKLTMELAEWRSQAPLKKRTILGGKWE